MILEMGDPMAMPFSGWKNVVFKVIWF